MKKNKKKLINNYIYCTEPNPETKIARSENIFMLLQTTEILETIKVKLLISERAKV